MPKNPLPGTTVAVIWRPRNTMLPAFDAAQAWWRQQGVEPVYVDSPAGASWNAAAARNRAMREYGQPGRPLVIADADTHPQNLSAIQSTVAAARRDPDVVHLPYTEYQVRRIGSAAPVARFDWSVSGILVATPEAWWSIGGQDERFVGWAPEDSAFALAHRTLLHRPMPRLVATVIAYQHPSNPGREKRREPHALYERYTAADGNARKMRWIVKQTGGHA